VGLGGPNNGAIVSCDIFAGTLVIAQSSSVLESSDLVSPETALPYVNFLQGLSVDRVAQTHQQASMRAKNSGQRDDLVFSKDAANLGFELKPIGKSQNFMAAQNGDPAMEPDYGFDSSQESSA
jgi:hypothetical protein